MQTPVRILRSDIQDIPGARPEFSARDLARRDLILAAGCRVLARHGRLAITVASLAGALCLQPGAIRRFFPDMDSLLADILLRHIATIADAVAAIGQDEPNAFARRRAAYLALTQTAEGGPTEAHLLLLRDRRLLPPDLAVTVEAGRRSLGECLSDKQTRGVLGLLDMPGLTPPQIEATLASFAALEAGRLHPGTGQPPEAARPSGPPPAIPPQRPGRPMAPPLGRYDSAVHDSERAARASKPFAWHRKGLARAGPG